MGDTYGEENNEEDRPDEGGDERCPYCSSSESCEHLLLLVDLTFRWAEGGPLMQKFNDHWGQLCEIHGDDIDERELFDELLELVDDLADAESQYAQEGGPGQSSDYAMYFCQTREGVEIAVQRFKR